MQFEEARHAPGRPFGHTEHGIRATPCRLAELMGGGERLTRREFLVCRQGTWQGHGGMCGWNENADRLFTSGTGQSEHRTDENISVMYGREFIGHGVD
jgi:hypothetical protein